MGVRGSWLYREVNGEAPPRKPIKRASTLSRKPARNWKYRAWIRTLPCACCGLEPAGEAAHTGNDGGMGMKASDYSVVPLCVNCHTQGPGAYHRIGKQAFELAHNVCFKDLVKRLNRIWFHPDNQG